MIDVESPPGPPIARRRRFGFRVVTLMVAVPIVGGLAGLLIRAVAQAREEASHRRPLEAELLQSPLRRAGGHVRRRDAPPDRPNPTDGNAQGADDH